MQNAIHHRIAQLTIPRREGEAMGHGQALLNLLAAPAAAGAALYLVDAWEWTYLSLLAWVPAAAFASAWLARRKTSASFLNELAVSLNMVGILLVCGFASDAAMRLDGSTTGWLPLLPAFVLLACNIICLTGPACESQAEAPRAARGRGRAL